MSRFGFWPSGTSVNASSTHADNYANQCACNRTYTASNVLDGDNSTFWNDDTSYIWPDIITLTFGADSEVNLKGLSIVSIIDGFIVDFDVKVFRSQSWTTTHSIRNASSIYTDLSFSTASIANSNGVVEGIGGVSISVMKSQDEFSRIAEIRPVYDASSSSTSSTSSSATASGISSATATATQVSGSTSTSAAASGSSSGSHQSTGLIIGVAVAASVVAILLALAAFGFIKRKQKQKRRKEIETTPALIVYDDEPGDEKTLSKVAWRPVGSPAPVYTSAPSVPEPLWEMPASNPHNAQQQRRSADTGPQELPGQ